MSSRLPNYLRTHRKRLGFSQREVAFLVAVHGEAKVCRYERYRCRPSLETALACELIFRTPARELFRGMHQKVERQVNDRAAVLRHKLARAKSTAATVRKITALKAITRQL
jgi:DNA-binding XRE family transcriptional regulator